MLYINATKEIESLEKLAKKYPDDAKEIREEIKEIELGSKWCLTVDGWVESMWDDEREAAWAYEDFMLENKNIDASVDVERMY